MGLHLALGASGLLDAGLGLAGCGSVRRVSNWRSVGSGSGGTPAIFSTDPAIRRSGVLKSGRSIMARNRPITQYKWLCVNSDSRPSTATISNWNFCDLCAIRSGSECSCK